MREERPARARHDAPTPDVAADVPTPHLSAMIDSITRRLSGTLQHMPVGEFNALVRRMAEIEYKYEQARGGGPPASDAAPSRTPGDAGRDPDRRPR